MPNKGTYPPSPGGDYGYVVYNQNVKRNFSLELLSIINKQLMSKDILLKMLGFIRQE